jgi:hypothetical protein
MNHERHRRKLSLMSDPVSQGTPFMNAAIDISAIHKLDSLSLSFFISLPLPLSH